MQQAAGVDEVVHAPQADPLARALLERVPALAQSRPPRRGGVPERGVRVLDIAVERAVDVADLAERQRGHGEPVVVEVRELGRRQRQGVVEQRAREQARRRR